MDGTTTGVNDARDGPNGGKHGRQPGDDPGEYAIELDIQTITLAAAPIYAALLSIERAASGGAIDLTDDLLTERRRRIAAYEAIGLFVACGSHVLGLAESLGKVANVTGRKPVPK